MPGLIEAENLCRYYGARCAVRDIGFDLQRGDVLGFLGPNGAGKSTTLKIIAGALTPDSGRVVLGGVDLARDPVAAKRTLGFLPETPPLYRDLTVDEYLQYAGRLRGIGPRSLGQCMDRTKRKCGLLSVGRRLIGQLSKGYQQRVGIAQALIHNPNAIVLDEPTVGLDPIQIREIRDLIGELAQDHGILLSTHIIPEVRAVCNRVQIMHQGRLVYSDRIDQNEARSTTEHLLLGLSRPPGLDRLLSLPGVLSATVVDSGRFRVRLASGATTQDIAAGVISADWGLLELTPERATLEQIFVQLTAEEDGAPPPEAGL